MSIFDLFTDSRGTPRKATLLLSFPFLALLVILLVLLGVLDHRNHERNMVLQMRDSARAYFEQILITRLWNAEHGGVYVEVTGSTLPNLFLDDPQRDIVAVGGKKYTKINPAYMTRQISELAEKRGAYKFHITSLTPLNPANRPDEWEAKALRSFGQGSLEAYELADYGGSEYFRYMSPLFVTEECLGCHAKQGYKFGDIRGGISVSMPTVAIRSVHKALQFQTMMSLFVMGAFSLAFVVGTVWVFSKRLSRGLKKEIEAEKLKIAVQLAGAAAHELRQPMSIIAGFSEILKDKLVKGEDPGQATEIIIDQCSRMNGIITRMLNITTYRTRNYGDNSEILDLETEPETTREPGA